MTKMSLFLVTVLVIQCHSTLVCKDTLKEIRHISLGILGPVQHFKFTICSKDILKLTFHNSSLIFRV